MSCPWRATILGAALSLAVASAAIAQAASPQASPPAASPPAAEPAPKIEPVPEPKAETTPGAKDATFGVETTLTGRTIIYMKGNGNWDTALETLQDAFKSVYALIDKQGLQKAGPPMTIYTDFDDTSFSFQAAVPIAEAPKEAPKGDIAIGQTPAGKALKFSYKGSFTKMEDTIYNAIPEYLDEKQLEPSGTFIEEYLADPVTTPENKFDIMIYVLLK